MSSAAARRSVHCWECEALTAQPTTVILTIPTRVIGELSLCPDCYTSCCVPLDPHPVDPNAPVHTVLVEPGGADRRTID